MGPSARDEEGDDPEVAHTIDSFLSDEQLRQVSILCRRTFRSLVCVSFKYHLLLFSSGRSHSLQALRIPSAGT